jgi:hypothetical protein
MAAGLVDRVLHMSDVVGLIDAEAAKIPAVRGPYKKQDAEISNWRTIRLSQPIHRLLHRVILKLINKFSTACPPACPLTYPLSRTAPGDPLGSRARHCGRGHR